MPRRFSYVSFSAHMVYNRNMRFRQPLDDIFRTATRVKILRLLARNPEMVFTGREVARNIGVANSNVSPALSALEKSGVLHSMAKGRSLLYRLNTRHILAERLLPDLFQKEAGSLKDVTDEIPLDWPRDIRSLICYGSVARHEEQVEATWTCALWYETRPAAVGLSGGWRKRRRNSTSAPGTVFHRTWSPPPLSPRVIAGPIP